MAITTTAVAVGTTPTLLAAAPRYSSVPVAVLIQAPDDMSIGGPDVTPGGPFRVAAGAPFKIDLTQGSQLYAVVESGSTTVSVLLQGVGL